MRNLNNTVIYIVRESVEQQKKYLITKIAIGANVMIK